MMYLPILGALCMSFGTIFEKLELRRKKISAHWYTVVHFVFIIGFMLPFIYFFWEVKPGAYELKNVFIFFLIAVTTLCANLFLFYSYKREKITKLEPALAMEPLLVILFAVIFSFIFGEELYERNAKVVIPAIIAGVALVFSHFKKHHLKFNKYFLSALAAVTFFALDLVLSRLILDYYSPLTFYFIRCSIIFISGFVIFRPRFGSMDKKSFWFLLGAGGFWLSYRLIVYYGFTSLGVVHTILLIMLAPIFTFIFAHFILKEKMSWKNIVAALIIVGSVAYATIINP